MKAYSADTFTPGLLNGKPTAAKRLGLLGAAFAPGAGFSDYAGTFPAAEGGFEPSATQNWREGNYITSALQGLGAFGDAATLSAAALGPFAPIAAGVGMTAKAPRAAQKAVKGLIDSAQPAPKSVMPQVDELGFYSAVEKAVLDNPQQKGTGQQFLAQIQKTPGVKPEELQYTGLDQFLANKPNVTKTEIQDFLDTNRVKLQEVQLSSESFTPELFNSKYGKQGYEMAQTNDGPLFYKNGKQISWSELPEKMQNAVVSESIPQTKWHLGSRPGIQTEIPGGENYREVLLTLPDANTSKQAKIDAINEQYNTVLGGRSIAELPPAEKAIIDRLTIEHNAIADAPIGQDFRSSHFDQPNILAHLRVNDRTVDGKPTLFVEEIQSDWHQTGRKKGYQDGKINQEIDDIKSQLGDIEHNTFFEYNPERGTYDVFDDGMNYGGEFPTKEKAEQFVNSINPMVRRLNELEKTATQGVPDAPFKTSWHELTLKKAINEAASKGYDQIAFTTGKTQAERYDLSKQINSLQYNKPDSKSANKFGTVLKAFDKEGNQVINQIIPPNELGDHVGKELAEKLLNANADNFGVQKLSGVDLSIGGEGMKGFYDKILPKSLEKLGKKYGVKPVLTDMDTPDGKVQVWKFPVPKEMAESVKSQGQPLFQIGAGAVGLGAAGLLATEDEEF
jgi:hypothetical protein